MIDRLQQLPTLNEKNQWEYESSTVEASKDPEFVPPEITRPIPFSQKVRSPHTSEVLPQIKVQVPEKPVEAASNASVQKAQQAMEKAQDFLATERTNTSLTIQIQRVDALSQNLNQALTSPDLDSDLKNRMQSTVLDLQGYKNSLELQYSQGAEYQEFIVKFEDCLAQLDKIKQNLATSASESFFFRKGMKDTLEQVKKLLELQTNLKQLESSVAAPEFFRLDFFNREAHQQEVKLRITETSQALEDRFMTLKTALKLLLDEVTQNPYSFIEPGFDTAMNGTPEDKLRVQEKNQQVVIDHLTQLNQSPSVAEDQQMLAKIQSAVKSLQQVSMTERKPTDPRAAFRKLMERRQELAKKEKVS